MTVTPRRRQLLDLAATAMAERGYHGVSISDLAEAAGISGPALYRHFESKQALLGELLIEISRRLRDGGKALIGGSPMADLDALLAWHVNFAVTESALIRVHERDLSSTTDADRRTIRRLQREYAELWVDRLRQLHPSLDVAGARLRVHATFGLLNSTPYVGRGIPTERARRELTVLGRAVLTHPV